MEERASKKNWTITSPAFDYLLEWLDKEENSDGQKYLEVRRRLVDYFDRKNCALPDELAEETLNRVAYRLEEAQIIESETPAKYCYIFARFVFLESLRRADKSNVSLDGILRKGKEKETAISNDASEERAVRERMLDCLEHCTAKLETENREIIVNYYGEERVKIENRRALAQKLETSSNALSIRACRIRDKLEICVKKCANKT